MGRALVEARQKHAARSRSSTEIKVTVRLTRLDPTPSQENYDSRIQTTIERLREMNLDVVVGDLPPVEDELIFGPGVRSAPQYCPSHRINLDLSMLIALISDITHAELPTTSREAYARFQSNSMDSRSMDDDDADSRAHGHALGAQLVHEMSTGLIDEIRKHTSHPGTSQVTTHEFWTSSEAKHRCLAIISTVGGPREKLRAEAMFSVDGAERFWASSRSRYCVRPLKDLIPIHVIEDSELFGPGNSCQSPHFERLYQTCSAILLNGKAEEETKDRGREAGSTATEGGKVVRLNAKLTGHTVQSMMQGAMRGYTTLTANKASVRAILREAAKCTVNGSVADESEIDDGHEQLEAAVFWVTEPRSLAEQLQSDYGG